MTNHDLSAGGDVLDRVTAFARTALADYGIPQTSMSGSSTSRRTLRSW